MIGAIVLGPSALSPADTFDPLVVSVAIVVHLTLSVVYGTFLVFVKPAFNIVYSVLFGGLYGLMLYYINFYGFNSFSSWFAVERNWVTIASHFIYGAVVVATYRIICARSRRKA